MKLDLFLQGQLELMKMLLIKYVDHLSRLGTLQPEVWGETALEVVKMAVWGDLVSMSVEAMDMHLYGQP